MTSSVKSLGRLVDLHGEVGARDQFQRLVRRLVQIEHPDAGEIRVRLGVVDTFVGSTGSASEAGRARTGADGRQ